VKYAIGSVVLLALGGIACGGRAASHTVPVPAAPSTAVEQFLAAVQTKDLATMGQLWGPSRGPAAESMNKDELHKRLTIMQTILVHERYTLEVANAVVATPDEQLIRVRLERNGCQPVVPFTVVRYRSGWLVKAIDLEAAGNPARSCRSSTP
jgi:hypothetical protein